MKRYPRVVFYPNRVFPRVKGATHIPKDIIVSVRNGEASVTRTYMMEIAYVALLVAIMFFMYVNFMVFRSINEQNASMGYQETSDIRTQRVREERNFTFITNNSKPDGINEEEAASLSKALIKWGDHFNVPQEYLLAVGMHESHFDRYAVSTSNALGFFQVIPKYHLQKIQDAHHHTGKRDLFDPEVQAYLVASILSKYREASKGSMDGALIRYYGSQSVKDNHQYKNNVNARVLKVKKFITISM
jgi:soluble lytic murein transglycosylase-like protein